MATKLPDILYQGSVKNVRGYPEDDFVIFDFSDRYSIFDWGEMPDLIEKKGESLARFTDAIYNFFERADLWQNWDLDKEDIHPGVKKFLKESKGYKLLQKKGILTHRYHNLENGESRIGNCWKVRKIFVPTIKNKNYSFYKEKVVDALVPLEVIFRFGTPTGSSLLRRLEKNPDYMYSLGLDAMPKEMQWFDRPIIEFSTKLEGSDRYIPYSEAKKMAGLSEDEFQILFSYASLLALRLKSEFTKIGLDLWDGKFEFSFLEGSESTRDFQLVDSIGLDEIRVTNEQIHLSKEILRQYYVNSNWYKKMESFKEKYEDWQEQMKTKKVVPEALPKNIKQSVEAMYEALAAVVEDHFLYQKKPLVNLNQVVQTLKADLRKGKL